MSTELLYFGLFPYFYYAHVIKSLYFLLNLLILATYVATQKYSTARFKLHAREYMSTNTFSPSSQPMPASKGSMFASKGSMLSSKGYMLLCMILLAIEIDICVQLLAHI